VVESAGAGAAAGAVFAGGTASSAARANEGRRVNVAARISVRYEQEVFTINGVLRGRDRGWSIFRIGVREGTRSAGLFLYKKTNIPSISVFTSIRKML
jgi:hypothetical protein